MQSISAFPQFTRRLFGLELRDDAQFLQAFADGQVIHVFSESFHDLFLSDPVVSASLFPNSERKPDCRHRFVVR